MYHPLLIYEQLTYLTLKHCIRDKSTYKISYTNILYQLIVNKDVPKINKLNQRSL